MQDILVVGGGINGAGIARDAAGRGYSVTLCEQGDLASGTSSASTKLIHGGLRYLEYADFMMVREALVEREVLLRMAPHIIWPLRFVLPHTPGMRSAWLLRLGLLIYDRLGGRDILPASRRVDLRRDVSGRSLSHRLRTAFEYSDCWADDSRLVVLNAVDAARRGATILTRTRVTSARRKADAWTVDIRDSDGRARTLQARALINAAGPWVADMSGRADSTRASRPVRLVKGSHLVTKRLFDGEQAYIFQVDDARIVFAIPYERDFTLIGTTEVAHSSMQVSPAISDAEQSYLLSSVARYFARELTPSDIVSTYSGVRPLLDEAGKTASAVSREYVIDLDVDDGNAPVITVYGGKLTTYRTLAEAAIAKLQEAYPVRGAAWTATSSLPGGDIGQADFDSFEADMQRRYPWLHRACLHRLLRAYGTDTESIVGSAERCSDLGIDFGHGLSEAEVEFLHDREFAMTADDILWRRSKMGLRLEQLQVSALGQWMAARRAPRTGIPDDSAA